MDIGRLYGLQVASAGLSFRGKHSRIGSSLPSRKIRDGPSTPSRLSRSSVFLLRMRTMSFLSSGTMPGGKILMTRPSGKARASPQNVIRSYFCGSLKTSTRSVTSQAFAGAPAPAHEATAQKNASRMSLAKDCPLGKPAPDYSAASAVGPSPNRVSRGPRRSAASARAMAEPSAALRRRLKRPSICAPLAMLSSS